MNEAESLTPADLADKIRHWGRELGFQQVGITGVELDEDEERLKQWLNKKRHGEMQYMTKHGTKRTRPNELIPKTVSVISARMNYMSDEGAEPWSVINDPNRAFISRYALARDYHKILRSRLKKLGQQVQSEIETFGFRVFTDSAPVLERALARKAGLGWFGKHSNLISRDDGSWFFLGEIYTDYLLPQDPPFEVEHCGSCVACIDVCPTKAIVAPYEVDARRCISYLTIEFRGVIPIEYRPLIGNRIFGCDDCQLVCPWNKFTHLTGEGDFSPRHSLDNADLVDLFNWTEEEFLTKTQGSAIRRTGYEGWLRNLAVAMGNAPKNPKIIAALESRKTHPSLLVQEHIDWAIAKQQS